MSTNSTFNWHVLERSRGNNVTRLASRTWQPDAAIQTQSRSVFPRYAFMVHCLEDTMPRQGQLVVSEARRELLLHTGSVPHQNAFPSQTFWLAIICCTPPTLSPPTLLWAPHCMPYRRVPIDSSMNTCPSATSLHASASSEVSTDFPIS